MKFLYMILITIIIILQGTKRKNQKFHLKIIFLEQVKNHWNITLMILMAK